MEYLVIFLFVWAAAATVLVLRGRAKLKNVMKEQQQCREKYREALLWKNNRKEYRIANQFEAGLLGCLPVVELGSRTLHPVVRIEMSDEKPKLTLVGADVLAESWLGDEECHATVMHVVNRLSAEEYDDFIRQLESGFQD